MIKNFTSIFLIFCFCSCCYSNELSENNDSSIIVGLRPISPMFPGGNDSLVQYIKSSFKDSLIYDESKSKENRLIVKFLVDKFGVVKNPEIVKNNVTWLKHEDILDIFLKMPKWNPSMMNGIAMEQYFTIPIFVKLKK